MEHVYRKPGEIDKGEPPGFPEVLPVERGPIVQAAASDLDVARFERGAVVRQRNVRAARWAVAMLVAFVAGVVLAILGRS